MLYLKWLWCWLLRILRIIVHQQRRLICLSRAPSSLQRHWCTINVSNEKSRATTNVSNDVWCHNNCVKWDMMDDNKCVKWDVKDDNKCVKWDVMSRDKDTLYVCFCLCVWHNCCHMWDTLYVCFCLCVWHNCCHIWDTLYVCLTHLLLWCQGRHTKCVQIDTQKCVSTTSTETCNYMKRDGQVLDAVQGGEDS